MDTDSNILNRLHELQRETDFDFVVELIDIYLKEAPQLIKEIETALKEHHSTAFVTAAHKLKGSSMNIGAQQLGALCLKLEELGRSGDMSKLPNINDIEAEFQQVKLILEDFKKNA